MSEKNLAKNGTNFSKKKKEAFDPSKLMELGDKLIRIALRYNEIIRAEKTEDLISPDVRLAGNLRKSRDVQKALTKLEKESETVLKILDRGIPRVKIGQRGDQRARHKDRSVPLKDFKIGPEKFDYLTVKELKGNKLTDCLTEIEVILEDHFDFKENIQEITLEGDLFFNKILKAVFIISPPSSFMRESFSCHEDGISARNKNYEYLKGRLKKPITVKKHQFPSALSFAHEILALYLNVSSSKLRSVIKKNYDDAIALVTTSSPRGDALLANYYENRAEKIRESIKAQNISSGV